MKGRGNKPDSGTVLASLAEQEPELLELICESVAGGHLGCAVRREIRYGAGGGSGSAPGWLSYYCCGWWGVWWGVWDVCQPAPILSKRQPVAFFLISHPAIRR